MFTHVRNFLVDDTGSATVEAAIIVLVLAGLAGVLWLVVNGESVKTGLEGIIQKALATTPG